MTVLDRFTIQDPVCGLVATAATKERAQELARHHQKNADGSISECQDVTLYDRMAHRGRPQEWQPCGFILAWRPVRDQPDGE